MREIVEAHRSDTQREGKEPMRRARVVAFLVLCAAAAVLAATYATSAVRRASPHADATTKAVTVRLPAPPQPPYLMVESMIPDSFRKLLLVPLSAPAGAGFETPLACDRAYVAGNRGVCLTVEGNLVATYYADIFDDRFVRLHRVRLSGLPSRTRLSPDGRRAGITVFEQGHSYAEHGFSTRTTILDTMTGRVLGDLEQFNVVRDGVRFQAVDFNFWGVTFMADSNRFFATLASGGVKYLVQGNVDGREARVVRTGVECPSLSPDNTRIAYKHLIDGRGTWQLRVYDLRSLSDTALTIETRSVDDQVDWIDNDRVLYHITGSRGADVWVLRTDNTESPKILREYAYSPAVVR